jgi:uncharacterized protein (DUF1810 family)
MTTELDDPFDLARFSAAQSPVYEQVLAELRNGCKRGHWVWFIFPQLRGLGSSETANRFGIASRAEAEAYVSHPLLGARLRECTRLVNEVRAKPAHEIFGYPDDLKFRSSITLFASVASDGQIFRDALEKYFGGSLDPLTTERLE